jgi:hypothetical protein
MMTFTVFAMKIANFAENTIGLYGINCYFLRTVYAVVYVNHWT